MPSYHQKNVLIAGGAGFIGSHLAHALIERGARVTIIDNLFTGKLENIQSIKNQIVFMQEDICNYQACLAATRKQHFVFHCAAFISAPDSLTKPMDCFATNVAGTLNLLWAAHTNRVERFIFSSSAAVYGHQESICHEELTPQPLSPYGDSKRIGELLCQHFFTAHKLPTLSLRYFNVFGPHQSVVGPYAPVIAQFQERMVMNQPIIIYGDGSQTRDFVPIKKIIEANLSLALLPEHLIGGKIINVASGKSSSINTVLHDLRQQFPNYTGTITYLPERPGDIKHSQADIKKLNRLLFYDQQQINSEWHNIKLLQQGC